MPGESGVTFAAGNHDETRIYVAAGRCQQGFKRLLSDSPKLARNEQQLQIIYALDRRFGLWAGSVGAFAEQQTSLDERLRYHLNLKAVILQLLHLLTTNLEHEFWFHSVNPESQANMNTSLDPHHSSSIERADIASSDTPLAIQAATDAIKETLDRLHALATIIRKASPSSLVSRVENFSSKLDPFELREFESIALCLVKGLLRGIQDGLARQLASSIVSRRLRLLYHRRHQVKLDTPRTPHEPIYSATAVDIPKRLSHPNQHAPSRRPLGQARPDQPLHRIPDALSETNPTTLNPSVNDRDIVRSEKPLVDTEDDSTSISVGQGYSYPQPPEAQEGDISCRCDWCPQEIMISNLRNAKWWRTHFKKDLQPYVCISEECAQPPKYFESFSRWRKHMEDDHTRDWARKIHKPSVWYCDDDTHEYLDFDTPDELRQHLISEHGETQTTEQINQKISRNTMPFQRKKNICPLCNQNILAIYQCKELHAQPVAPSRSGGMKQGSQRSVRFTDEPESSSDKEEHPTKGTSFKDTWNETDTTARTKVSIHVGAHLKSLAFLSIRNFKDKEDSEPKSSEGTADRIHRKEASEDVSMDSLSLGTEALVFEDVPLSERSYESGQEIGSVEEEAALEDYESAAASVDEEMTSEGDFSDSRLLDRESLGFDDVPLDKRSYEPEQVIIPSGEENNLPVIHDFIRPMNRDGFEIAIICALPLEYDATTLIFDEFWDEDGDTYGRAPGDYNHYATGRIGKCNVVLALLPHMGKSNAASLAASLRSSYNGLRLVLLVGICGGVPRTGGEAHDEILLGDVVISKQVVQYDFGRQYPDKFERKNTLEDSLGKAPKDVRSLLTTFEAERNLGILVRKTSISLQQLQGNAEREGRRERYRYPGPQQDRLFPPNYRHKHSTPPRKCIECWSCLSSTDPVCEGALKSTCDDLGCAAASLIPRQRLEAKRFVPDIVEIQKPAIHVGSIASGDTVMKSGEERDRIARQERVIAFEMEGAGAWEELPCIVVKGVCDYADCHKTKKWQAFAAATAASATRAILERYVRTDGRPTSGEALSHMSPALVQGEPMTFSGLNNPGRFATSAPSVIQVPLVSDGRANDFSTGPAATPGLTISTTPKPRSTVPFGPDPDFVDRPSILQWMRDRITRPPHRIALVGLGGIGKSQLAIHYASSVRKDSPDTWVFWVHAGTAERFKQGYQDIAEALQLPGRADPNMDVLVLVHRWLCNEENGSWLMILDNADDIGTLYSSQPQLASRVPQSGNGLVLITSRSKDVAQRLTGDFYLCFEIPVMNHDQACRLLQEKLGDNYDESTAAGLAHTLDSMPLALTQAAAFINRRAPRMTITRYLEEFYGSQSKKESLLNKDSGDLRRDPSAKNSIVTTWQITFEQIQRERASAAYLLSFMSFFNPQGIPGWALQAYYDWRQSEAMVDFEEDTDMLRGYSIVKITRDDNVFEMHPLVQHCTQIWLATSSNAGHWRREFLWAMAKLYPAGEFENWETCKQLEPHIATIIQEKPGDEKDVEEWTDLLHNAGWYRFKSGRYKEAEQMYRRAVQAQVELWGTGHPTTLASMNGLADVLTVVGKLKEAETLSRQVFEAYRRLLGQDHPVTLRSMDSLAGVMLKLGRYAEAEQLWRQVLVSQEKEAAQDDRLTLPAKDRLAVAVSQQGRHEEAEQLQQQLLELSVKTLGETHQNTLRSMQTLADTLRMLDRLDEAEELMRRALALMEEVLGQNDPSTLQGVGTLALILEARKKYDEAEQLHRQALELQTNLLGKDHYDTADTAYYLARYLYNRGRATDAADLCAMAYNVCLKTYGANHPHTVDSKDLGVAIRKAIENDALPRPGNDAPAVV